MFLYVQTDDEYLKMLYNTTKNHDSDSGFDLYVPTQYVIKANSHSNVIGMGIRCNMVYSDYIKYNGHSRMYYESRPFMIFPRSSMGSKTPLRLANSIGLVDKDYRGEIKLIVDNISDKDYLVSAGSRLAQIVSFNGERFEVKMVDSLSDTQRGYDGLGSTGI